MLRKEGERTKSISRIRLPPRRKPSCADRRSASKKMLRVRRQSKSTSKPRLRTSKKALLPKPLRSAAPNRSGRPKRAETCFPADSFDEDALAEGSGAAILLQRKVTCKEVVPEPLLDLDELVFVIPRRQKKVELVQGALQDEECSICLELFERDISALECGHLFHTDCINDWLTKRRVCPICNEGVRRLTIEG